MSRIYSLPHPASICAWAASVECEPGYLMNVIKLVGQIAAQNKYMSKAVLVVDAMAIHKEHFGIKSYIDLLDALTMVLQYQNQVTLQQQKH